MSTRSILLLATNKREYLKFAINFAESIKLHNKKLPIFIVTNINADYAANNIKFLSMSDDVAKLQIEAKLYLNDFLQTEETLFIDADCLCYANLDPLFDACKGRDVTVIGHYVSIEDYWKAGEADFAKQEFGIDKIIVFNGGFYCFKKTALTNQIFNRAREICAKYDEYGFPRMNNGLKNEENMMAIPMVANNQWPIMDKGQYIADLRSDHRPRVLNVLKGKRLLRNPAAPSIQHRNGYPLIFSPLVLHFGGSNIKSYPYVSQSALIGLYKHGFPIVIASLIVDVFIHIPYKSYHWLRKILNELK